MLYIVRLALKDGSERCQQFADADAADRLADLSRNDPAIVGVAVEAVPAHGIPENMLPEFIRESDFAPQ